MGNYLQPAGGIGPRQPQSPTDALATFLGMAPDDPGLLATPHGTSAQYTPGSYTDEHGQVPTSMGELSTPFEQEQTARANSANAVDHKRMSDLQALSDTLLPDAQTVKNLDSGRKMQEAAVVPTIQGKTAMDIENMKAQSAENVARIKDGPTGSDPNYLADQVQRSPAMLTRLPPKDKEAVLQVLGSRGADLEDLTNQAKARAETATTILPQLDELMPMAKQLQDAGWFAPGFGSVRRTLAEHGMGMLTGDSHMADLMGKFQSKVGLVTSALQNAHAGARGAAQEQLRKVFESFMNAQGDLPTFSGGLSSVRSMLAAYAGADAPVHNGVRQDFGTSNDFSSPPTAAELAGGR